MTNIIRTDEHARPWVTRLLLAAALVLALFLPGVSPARARQPLAAIVVDARTGKVLYARGADAPRYPASITKVMTLYLLFRELKAGRLSLRSRVRMSRHAASMQPSKLWLKPGQSISVDQAIRALAVKSANDVAVAVAEKLAGSERAFARRMTLMARALGMTRTTFRNASGLPYPPNVTTARDLATLSLRLMRDFPRYYRRYFGLRYMVWRGRRHRNHNHLLGRVAGMDGIKTGYTRAAGSNLAASVRRGGKRIVAVVLGAPSSRARNAYMVRLIESAFRRRRLASGSRIAALAGMPPGYSTARAKALLARLEGARRQAAARRRRASSATRPKQRPQVKMARIAPSPAPEAARALARLASRAAAMPIKPESAKRPAPASGKKAAPPLPRMRPKRVGGDETKDRPATSAPGAPATAGRKVGAHSSLLATNVTVRVPDEPREATTTDAASASGRVAGGESHAAERPAHARKTPESAASPHAAVETPVLRVHAAEADGTEDTALASAAQIAPPLRTQVHVKPDAEPAGIVITKTSAPPPRKNAVPESGRTTPPRLAKAVQPTAPDDTGPSGAAEMDSAVRLIADDPRKVRRLLSTHWVIQIGALPSLDAAQLFLLKAHKVSQRVRNAQPFVLQVRKNGKVFYRARIAGFSREQAYKACRALKRRGFSCLPMAPGAG